MLLPGDIVVFSVRVIFVRKSPPRLPGAEADGANFEPGFQAGVYDVSGRTLFIGLRFAS